MKKLMNAKDLVISELDDDDDDDNVALVKHYF